MRQVGRLGRLLAFEEAAYGDTPALLATMAVRHLNFTAEYQPRNRVPSEEKKATRGRKVRFDRARTAGFDLTAILRPSGTIGTIPEAHTLLRHGFGAAIVGTLNGTVAAAASTTVFTLQAGEGASVVAGEFVSVRRAANGNVPEARRVLSKAGDELTLNAPLGGIPAANDTVKAGVTYRFGALAKSIGFAHYLTDLKRTVKGGLPNELTLSFERNKEPEFRLAGPAQQAPRGAAALPGFTTVGSQNPPSGLAGSGLIVNGVARKFMKCEVSIDLGRELISENYGTSMAEAFDEPDFRDVTFSFERRADTDYTLYDLAEDGALFDLLLQTGLTEGNIVAIHAPKAEIEHVPQLPDDNGVLTHSFAGVLNENAGDDEVALGLL